MPNSEIRAAQSLVPPRHLRREQAAAYVGVSVDTFDWEVASGVWPPGRPRGRKGGLLTWDRLVLDAVSNGFPEAEVLGKLAPGGGPASAADSDEAARAAWRTRLNAAPAPRPQHGH